MRRREFGSVRRLPSGRWQVRYTGLDGRLTPAPTTFASRHDATVWLAGLQTDLARGSWADPARGAQQFGVHARSGCPSAAIFARARSSSPRAAQTPPRVAARIRPVGCALPDPGTRMAHRASSGRCRSVHRAKAYRLLRTILNTAVADEVIARNPCVLRGAGHERTPHRRAGLRDRRSTRCPLPHACRAGDLVGLRWGELTALRRVDVNVAAGQIVVTQQLVQTSNALMIGPPKSAAGRRVVHLPPHVLPQLTCHLENWVGPDPVAWLFCGAKGAPLVRSNFTNQTGARNVAATRTCAFMTCGICQPRSRPPSAPRRESS